LHFLNHAGGYQKVDFVFIYFEHFLSLSPVPFFDGRFICSMVSLL
jgi:hypothetical protein